MVMYMYIWPLQRQYRVSNVGPTPLRPTPPTLQLQCQISPTLHHVPHHAPQHIVIPHTPTKHSMAHTLTYITTSHPSTTPNTPSPRHTPAPRPTLHHHVTPQHHAQHSITIPHPLCNDSAKLPTYKSLLLHTPSPPSPCHTPQTFIPLHIRHTRSHNTTRLHTSIPLHHKVPQYNTPTHLYTTTSHSTTHLHTSISLHHHVSLHNTPPYLYTTTSYSTTHLHTSTHPTHYRPCTDSVEFPSYMSLVAAAGATSLALRVYALPPSESPPSPLS